jgi:hypothetical protein
MKNYKLLMFNNGEVLATTEPINSYPESYEPKLIASGLTKREAYHLEYIIYNDDVLYNALNNFLSENRSWIHDLKDTLKEMTEKKEEWASYAIELELKVEELERKLKAFEITNKF